jgi:hypothetical protein
MTVNFPTWARIALGVLVAFVGFMLTGGVFTVDDDARALIGGLVALLASAGVVPPRHGDIPAMSAGVRFAATVVVIAATYFIQQLDDETLRGIMQAAILLAASIGIVPPQADRRVAQRT